MKTFWLFGVIFGLGSVAAGAFGAHALRDRLSGEMLAVFETAVRYQMYHSLALLAASWAMTRWPGTVTTAAGWAFVAGITVFSGSLYLLVLTGTRWWGAVTPVGGLALLTGWALLGLAALRGP